MSKTAPSIDTLFSVGPGGARNFLHPASVQGRFTRWRRIVFTVLIAIFVILPFVTINGRPGIWLDIGRRSFHLLGMTVGPTESHLLFLGFAGSAFLLVVVSALWGRIWCGWACPQTVWIEGVFRQVERLFEGDRNQQIALEAKPWGLEKIGRRGGKVVAFVVLSALIGHLFICYFVPPKDLWAMMRQGPRADLEVFLWSAAITAFVYFDFAWFREQFCIILCPYGRMQSVLSDQDTVVVGYDAKRGEPRGKPGSVTGDCVDCQRCVAVCPTGIDIRQGLQLECVGCAACVDACDEIMARLKRAPGLVRYDSQRGFTTGARRFLRPRLYLYGALTVVGLIAGTLMTRARPDLPVTLVRQVGAPFVVDNGVVRNAFLLRLANKEEAPLAFSVDVAPALAGAKVTLAQKDWSVPAAGSAVIPIFVEVPRATFTAPFEIVVKLTSKDGRLQELKSRFLGP